jgi:hypothetical protein
MIKHLFFLFLPICTFGQTTFFEKVFGTSGIEISRSVKQINGGSIFVFGNSNAGPFGDNDISLSKLDRQGNEMWTHYYGTSFTENGFYLNTTADGNFVFVAEVQSASSLLDILIYKVDSAGSVIWNKTYATPVNETAKYIEQTSDGGYIIAGSQNDALGLNDILVLKLDSNGDYLWHQTLGRSENDYGDMIHEINSGYILTGDTKSYGAGGYDVILYRLDLNGIETWSQPYGDSLQNGCQGLLLTADENYLSYGETEIAPSSAFDFYLEKIDTNGLSMWKKTFGGIGSDAIFSVINNGAGGYIFTGYSNSYNSSEPLDLVIMNLDSMGNQIWVQTYGGSGIDIGYEIIKSVDNNGFILTGKTIDSTEQYYLLKLDANGVVSEIEKYQNSFYSISNAFPNPANSFVSIKYDISDSSQKRHIVLYDIFGKSLKKISLFDKKGTAKMNVEDLNSGIYFYSLVIDEKVISTKKLVISSK